MRIKTLFISQLIVMFLYPCFSQDTYQVGFSHATLEPDDQFVSLALAGYAGPWEGRFTLQWKEQGAIPSYIGIAGGENHLCYIDGHSLFRRGPTDALRWEKIGEAAGIRHIAAAGNRIYGLTSDGQLKKGDLSKKRFRWKVIGTVDLPVSAITISGKKLYL
ncbi:MAG: hypothetical protein JJE08_11555, partial [Proteiniphilum sp.]|nr:hypothetical protein [Proteiniphilum sp.]